MEVAAKATRSGGWWAVEVPELGGAHTQARRLEQVEEMVRDIAALMRVEISSVAVVPNLSAEDARLVDEAAAASAALKAANDRAAKASRAAVSRLTQSGMTVRDVGKLLGVSAQRVAQLSKT